VLEVSQAAQRFTATVLCIRRWYWTGWGCVVVRGFCLAARRCPATVLYRSGARTPRWPCSGPVQDVEGCIVPERQPAVVQGFTAPVLCSGLLAYVPAAVPRRELYRMWMWGSCGVAAESYTKFPVPVLRSGLVTSHLRALVPAAGVERVLDRMGMGGLCKCSAEPHEGSQPLCCANPSARQTEVGVQGFVQDVDEGIMRRDSRELHKGSQPLCCAVARASPLC
jgi:hypothetical protein